MNITINEVPLEVEFDYYPGYRGKRDSLGVPEEPDEGPDVDIGRVCIGDSDVTDLLSVESFREIEKRVLERIKKGV
jgi:hypothetical protein